MRLNIKPPNSVKQLSFNKKKIIKRKKSNGQKKKTMKDLFPVSI